MCLCCPGKALPDFPGTPASEILLVESTPSQNVTWSTRRTLQNTLVLFQPPHFSQALLIAMKGNHFLLIFRDWKWQNGTREAVRGALQLCLSQHKPEKQLHLWNEAHSLFSNATYSKDTSEMEPVKFSETWIYFPFQYKWMACSWHFHLSSTECPDTPLISPVHRYLVDATMNWNWLLEFFFLWYEVQLVLHRKLKEEKIEFTTQEKHLPFDKCGPRVGNNCLTARCWWAQLPLFMLVPGFLILTLCSTLMHSQGVSGH